MKFERDLSTDPLAPELDDKTVELTVKYRLSGFRTGSPYGIEEVMKAAFYNLDGAEFFVEEGGKEEFAYLTEVLSIETTGNLEKQIKHIEEHSQAFEDHVGQKQSVAGYFADYGHIPDLYERLCSDLGIEPRYT